MTNILGAGFKMKKIDVSMYSKKLQGIILNLLFQNEYYLTQSLITDFGLR